MHNPNARRGPKRLYLQKATCAAQRWAIACNAAHCIQARTGRPLRAGDCQAVGNPQSAKREKPAKPQEAATAANAKKNSNARRATNLGARERETQWRMIVAPCIGRALG